MCIRDRWSSNFGFLMAAIGSAVGLGNIWGFPYKMGANGGGAFLLVYVILVVFVGFAVMLGELTIGRKTGKGAVGAYRALNKKLPWVGYMGVGSAFLILGFYSVLGGMVMRYMLGFLVNMFGGAGFAAEGFFGRLKNEFFYGRDWRGVAAAEFMERLDAWMRFYSEGRLRAFRDNGKIAYDTIDNRRRRLGLAV